MFARHCIVQAKYRVVHCLVWLALCVIPQVQAALLDDDEQAYVASHQPRLCVDPDWWPFEIIDAAGQHVGIAADFHALIHERVGLRVRLNPARTWDEQLNASKSGDCELLSFVNRTPEREKWLTFTEPLLIDPNVLITREEHPFISDLGSLRGKRIALPRGTAIHERISKDFPHLAIIGTVSEEEAIGMVSNRQADMTLRSRIVAASVIKHHGWFNLKINGQVPGYENQLRIGVLKSEPALRDILNKGIATISTEERQRIVDRHVEIKMVTDIDYTLVKWLTALIVSILLTSLFWFWRLRKINAALQGALTEVQETEAEQRQFISMLSHEIRSPLAVIDSTAQLLALKMQEEHESHPVVARIRRGVARLAGFFDNSLTQDRLNSKNFALQQSELDIAEVATWAVESAELLAERHIFELDLAPDMPPLQGDQTLLRILLGNLLSNASKYSPPGTLIRLRVYRRDQACILEVSDQGAGIPADELPLIFQRFRRGRAVENTPGAGLGLSLVARIVALHGGQISVTSTPGQGSTFVVTLPLPSGTPPAAA
jgi:signal transduction histidine kinase